MGDTLVHYRCIAVGFLFVTVNILIGGLGIVFPTCVGYLLIAAGCWSLRSNQAIFSVASAVAVLLALLTFPNLFRYMIDGQMAGYYGLMFWPIFACDLFMMAMIAYGISREADIKGDKQVKRLCDLFWVVVVCSIAVWLISQVVLQYRYYYLGLFYNVPALYMGILAFRSAQRIG